MIASDISIDKIMIILASSTVRPTETPCWHQSLCPDFSACRGTAFSCEMQQHVPKPMAMAIWDVTNVGDNLGSDRISGIFRQQARHVPRRSRVRRGCIRFPVLSCLIGELRFLPLFCVRLMANTEDQPSVPGRQYVKLMALLISTWFTVMSNG